MDAPTFLVSQLNVRICRAGKAVDRTSKFAFALGEEEIGDFSLTKRCLHVLRSCIEQEGCLCLQLISQTSKHLWDLMARISRERFWVIEPPPTPSLFAPTFELLQCDFTLSFETLGLIMLNPKRGRSFLHIHSGPGYACTIAAFLLTSGGANHGVEFRSALRVRAKLTTEHLLRLHPKMQTDNSPPLYHARFPADLLDGRAKFDYILVTDCFERLEDVLSLKDLLNPSGVLVTGFAGELDDAMCVGMMVVINEDALPRRSFEIHTVAEGKVGQFILNLRFAQRATIRRMDEARASPADQPCEAALPSLRTIALRACSRRSDPIAALRGDSGVLLRPPPRLHQLPNMSVQLIHVAAAFRSFRAECLSSAEDALDPDRQQAMLEELAHLVAALEDLGKQFVGRQNFSLWRAGEALRLSMPQGVVVWLLENIFHVLRYSGIQHFEISLFDSDLFDEPSSVLVTQPLLKAFIRFFRRVDLSVLEQRPPWNFQLSFVQKTRRALTKLAARLWTDAACLVRLVLAMKALCGGRGGEEMMPEDAAINFNLLSCQSLLTSLSERVLHQSESFTSLEIVLDSFRPLNTFVRHIHRDAVSIMADAPSLQVLSVLFYCARVVCASALQNLACSGRPQWCGDPSLKPQFLSVEGGLIDPALFQAERDFLEVGPLRDPIPAEEACSFLVRRAMSDLEEVLWAAEGRGNEKRLAVLEESRRLYYMEVLQPHLPVHFIDTTLRAMK